MENRRFEDTNHATLYVNARPEAPAQLADSIVDFIRVKYKGALLAAADIGCGSGQSSRILCPHFTSVTGVDVSEAQITEGRSFSGNPDNIRFAVGPAETLPFADNSLQVITAGTAAHWFDLPAFFKEVDRVLVPGGVVALYTYGFYPTTENKQISKSLEDLLDNIYRELLLDHVTEIAAELIKAGRHEDIPLHETVLPYAETKTVDSHYYQRPATVLDFIKYIESFSVFQGYQKAKGKAEGDNLLKRIEEGILNILQVKTLANETNLPFRVNYFMNMGRKPL